METKQKPINTLPLTTGMICYVIGWDIYGDGVVRSQQKVSLINHTDDNYHWEIRHIDGNNCGISGTGYRSTELFPVTPD